MEDEEQAQRKVGSSTLGGDTPRDGLDNTVVDNTLTGNGGYGIKMEREPQREVSGNTLSGNRLGPTGPSDNQSHR